MAVQIDEITAEIEPSRAEPTPAAPTRSAEASPETELRKQRDLLARFETRAARVCAD
jgi:hypothetical protein